MLKIILLIFIIALYLVVNNGNKNGEKVVIKGEICIKFIKLYDI